MAEQFDEGEFQTGVAKAQAQMRADYGINGFGDDEANSSTLIVTSYVNGVGLSQPLPPVEYLCESLGLPSGAGAPHCFGGFGFSGKTVVAQSACLSFTTGRDLWKAFTNSKRVPLRVTHVDNEQGIALTQRRYQRLAAAMGESLEEIADNLRVFVFPKIRTGRIYLIPEHRAAWLEMMSERDILLVDSLAASRDGKVKENESEVRRALDMLGELSEATRCRPFVIHHAVKGGDENSAPRDARFALRGSGAIFDAIDSCYMLSGERKEPVKIEQIKARSHGEAVDPFAVQIADVGPPENPKWGLGVTIHGIELLESVRTARREAKISEQVQADMGRIRKALSNGRRLSREDLISNAGLNGARYSRAWLALKETDSVQIEQVKQGRTWVKVHYLMETQK